MRSSRGFLLVTVLLVLLVVMALGVIVLGNTMHDIRFAEHEIAHAQAEEIARSGLAYYQAYGIPPLVNGKPQPLKLFPQESWNVEIAQEGDTLKLTGSIASGSGAQAVYRVPLWDLRDFEKP